MSRRALLCLLSLASLLSAQEKAFPDDARSTLTGLARAIQDTGFLAAERGKSLVRDTEAARSTEEIRTAVARIVQAGFDLQQGEDVLRSLGALLARPDLETWRDRLLPRDVELCELTLRGGLVLLGSDAPVHRYYPQISKKAAAGQIVFEPNLGVPGLGNWTIVKEDVKRRRRVRVPLPRLLLERAHQERITDDGALEIDGRWLELPGRSVRRKIVLSARKVTSGGSLFENEALGIRCVLPTHRYPKLIARHGLAAEFVDDSKAPRETRARSAELEALVEPLLEQAEEAPEFDLLNAPSERARFVLARKDLVDQDAEASLLRIRFALLYGEDLPRSALDDPLAFRDFEATVLEALREETIPPALARNPEWKSIATIVEHGRDPRQPHRSGEIDGTWVRFPSDYSIWRKWPLLVVLHGQYCRPDYDYRVWSEIAERAGMVLVCPRYGSTEGAPRTPEDDLEVLDVVRRLSLRHSLDSDRIYLSGISMGGAKSWSLASRYPDRFAAVAPEIHGPVWKRKIRGRRGLDFFLLPNLRALPVYVLEGRFDGLNTLHSRLAVQELTRLGAPVHAYEAPLIGHERLAWRYPSLLRSFATHRRPDPPARIRYRALQSFAARNAWLEILDVRRPAGWKLRDGRFSTADLCGIDATFRNGTLRITPEKGRPTKLRIHHAPSLMGQGPITISTGSKKRSWRPSPSTKHLLEQVIATGDRRRFYLDSTEINLGKR